MGQSLSINILIQLAIIVTCVAYAFSSRISLDFLIFRMTSRTNEGEHYPNHFHSFPN